LWAASGRDRAVVSCGQVPAPAVPDRDRGHTERSVGPVVRISGDLGKPADRDRKTRVGVRADVDAVLLE